MPDGQQSRNERPRGYHYARGVFRRIAEQEYHQPRQRRLRDYWHRPTGEEIVEDMVDKGWSEDEAQKAVKRLWLDQMQAVRNRGVCR